MNSLLHSRARWFRSGEIPAGLAPIGVRPPPQPPRKPPAKPPAQPSSQPKGDPLAPLLQQAKDAIDRNVFSPALEPLQKYIAQRPYDPYTHFQLGYSFFF